MFAATRLVEEIRAVWCTQLRVLRGLAEELRTEWGAVTAGLPNVELTTKARRHNPLLFGLLDKFEMGERAGRWISEDRESSGAGNLTDCKRDPPTSFT